MASVLFKTRNKSLPRKVTFFKFDSRNPVEELLEVFTVFSCNIFCLPDS